MYVSYIHYIYILGMHVVLMLNRFLLARECLVYIINKNLLY